MSNRLSPSLTRRESGVTVKVNGGDLADGGHGLPGGSSLFQEVMAELHPPPSPSPPALSPRRRKSTKVKHVHYVLEPGDSEASPPPQNAHHLNGDKGGDNNRGDDEGEEDEDDAKGRRRERERQILHGKCHCYFVENGTVTGLADHKCHHEHRTHPTPALSPSASPRPHRKLYGSTPSTPTPFKSNTPSPDGSPRSKLHPSHYQSSLLPPEFRGRSNSDTTAMARLSSAKRSGLIPASTSVSYGRNSPSPSSRSRTTSPNPRSLDQRPSSSVHAGSSQRHQQGQGQGQGRGDAAAVQSAADTMSSSFRISSPPPIVVQEATSLGLVDATTTSAKTITSASEAVIPGLTEATRARKLSTHVVPSDQLHYLYDQFLQQ